MFNKLFSQILLDLGNMEGEFRRYHLRDDAATLVIIGFCFTCASTVMIHVDFLFYRGDSYLFYWVLMFRILHVLVTAVFLFAAVRTREIQKFDVYTFAWLLFNGIYLLLFNFTRPIVHLTTTFDVLFVFGLYMLSPLQFKQTVALGVGFSIGALIVANFYKAGLSEIDLGITLGAHIFVQMMGLASTLRLQSLRRWSFLAYAKEKQASKLAHNLLHVDSLTKSLSRRHFFELAELEYERLRRCGLSISTLVMDLDHFKKINDAYGHCTGDTVLKVFAQFVMKEKRAQDIFGRLGGEEFCIILPDTDVKSALQVARRMQAKWAEMQIEVDSKIIHSTISIGIAESAISDRDFEELLNRADALMYKAKKRGRNRVAIK